MNKQEEIRGAWQREWQKLNETTAVKTIVVHIHHYRQYTGGVYCAFCGAELKEMKCHFSIA